MRLFKSLTAISSLMAIAVLFSWRTPLLGKAVICILTRVLPSASLKAEVKSLWLKLMGLSSSPLLLMLFRVGG